MNRYPPPSPKLPHVSHKRIPNGYLGTRKTLEHIQSLIRHGVKDFYVRQKAIDILLLRGIKPKDYLGEIQALFEWVQNNIRYTKDPFRVETLHTARRMLALKAGDCDDMTILLGAMLESIGHPVRLVIVGPDITRPRHFSHIYLEVQHRGKWIPLDATMPYPMGWKPRMLVKMTFPLNRRGSLISRDSSLSCPASRANPSTDWLQSLIQAVDSQAIAPQHPRVRRLIHLLRKRQLWGRSRWLQQFLMNLWQHGRTARPQTRAAEKLLYILRLWKVLADQKSLSGKTGSKECG